MANQAVAPTIPFDIQYEQYVGRLCKVKTVSQRGNFFLNVLT